MKFKLDSFKLGAILGIIIPLITIFFVYIIKFPGFGICELIDYLIEANALTKLTSLCILPDALLFFIFIYTNLLFSARGVLMSTMFYAILVFIAKFTL